jgi:adenylate kinase family enzyme
MNNKPIPDNKLGRMKKIAVIGHPGAGKSTLSVKMSELLRLPLIHLDKEFWKPGWQQPPRDEWREHVWEMAAGERWIMDGTYDNSLDIRLPQADTVVFLDFPMGLCMWRILKRMLGGYGRVRPDMGDGCRERIDLPFIKFVWEYRKVRRPRILAALEKYTPAENVINLDSPRAVNTFIDELGRSAMPE